MVRRTEVELLRDFLKVSPDQRASRVAISRGLQWDSEKVSRVVARALEDSSTRIQVGRGSVVKFLGSERGAADGVGIYKDVAGAIRRQWAERELGAREVEVFNTARSGRRGDGDWTHPDIVFAIKPRRKRSRLDPNELHCIEIETVAGFSIKSIYQAHAQARGADYAWVFTFAEAIDKGDRFGRISWAAQQLGIGLVQFTSPAAAGSYRTLFRPEPIKSTDEERINFVTRVMDQPEDSPLLRQ